MTCSVAAAPRRPTRLALLAAAFLACSGGDPGPAAEDASTGGFTPAACQVEFGRTFVFDSIEVLPPGEGVDITGDGVPDNMLAGIAPLSNPTIASSIENGTGIFLLDLTGWEDAPEDDDDLAVTLYLGVDADTPPDPSNNTSGQGRFLVIDRQFDVSCNPLTRQLGSVADGVLSASPEVWQFIVAGVGTLEYRRIELEFEVEPDLSAISGKFGTAWTVCNLSRVSGPLFAGGSLLDVIVNQLGHFVPDLDLDGDGLEELLGDGQRVIGCIDGDGTPIEGEGCVCDPRIADGYSVSVAVHGVPATIEGIIYSP
jgi:hypothetical protein